MRKHFNIAVLWLLELDGSKMLTGGLERWCRDVAYLIRDKGYDVTIYQKATTAFEKEIAPSIRVVGIKCPLNIYGNWFFALWLEKNTDTSVPYLFVSQEMALSKKINRAMAVNHGICWNGDKRWFEKQLNKPVQYRLINHLKGVICVDTNYINWCHAELRNRASWEHKLFFVPNYADLDLFPYVPKPRKVDELPIILFPRRVGGPCIERDGRGAGLLLKAFEILESQGQHLSIIFAGRGRLQKPIEDWAANHGYSKRITVTEVPLDEVPALYAQADVVTVPTLEQEGTAFAAVEGIVSGKPTIVSHIGGLGNLVIDGVNGYVCDLNADSLATCIRRALEAPPINQEIVKRCRESLGKPRWEKQVWSHIQRCLEIE